MDMLRFQHYLTEVIPEVLTTYNSQSVVTDQNSLTEGIKLHGVVFFYPAMCAPDEPKQ